jgi:hypothetical protein
MASIQVIFGGGEGALAGMSGIAAIGMQVVGFDNNQVRLEGLPLSVNVRIGKKATTGS